MIMPKRLILMIVLLCNAVVAVAQTECRIYNKAEQECAQKRKIEKRLEALQDSIRYTEALTALEQLDFVLEANRLSFKHGETAYVTSNTNFVSLADDKVIIQIAPFNGGGPNGVGGITLEGNATNIKLKTDKKGNISFSMNVSGSGLSATIDLSLPRDIPQIVN
ncbi:MAG: DUF4251 domain-containing protein [Muribaculaceae bacterium]